jgi:hypothetical protein
MMKLLLVIALIVACCLAIIHFFNLSVYAAPVIACITTPVIVLMFYPALLFNKQSQRQRPQQKSMPLKLHSSLTALDDQIAFTIATQGGTEGEGVVFAHVRTNRILNPPSAILKAWQIQEGELVQVSEQVYTDIGHAPSNSPHDRGAFSFTLTLISDDHVEAEITQLYSAGLHSKRRGGNAFVAHFDKTSSNLWHMRRVNSLLWWD